MTPKRTVQVLEDAGELIATGECNFLCLALERVLGKEFRSVKELSEALADHPIGLAFGRILMRIPTTSDFCEAETAYPTVPGAYKSCDSEHRLLFLALSITLVKAGGLE